MDPTNQQNKKIVGILKKSKKMSANKDVKLKTSLPEPMVEDSSLMIFLSPLLKARTYKHAKDRLIELISAEKENGKLDHDKYYYASQIARRYIGIDARKLAAMIK